MVSRRRPQKAFGEGWTKFVLVARRSQLRSGAVTICHVGGHVPERGLAGQLGHETDGALDSSMLGIPSIRIKQWPALKERPWLGGTAVRLCTQGSCFCVTGCKTCAVEAAASRLCACHARIISALLPSGGLTAAEPVGPPAASGRPGMDRKADLS